MAGAFERYLVRVPNEKQVDTIAVEVRIPHGIRVEAFEQKPGWTAEPTRDANGVVTSVRWTGNLAPREFTELGLIAVNPSSPGELVWSAVQRFSDGTSVEWFGPVGSPTPAARISISATDGGKGHDH
jgi:uncharacterized protein YcnI